MDLARGVLGLPSKRVLCSCAVRSLHRHETVNSLSGGEPDRAQVACLLAEGRRCAHSLVPLSLPAKASMELSQLMKLGLMLSDTAVSQRHALKELSRLVKLGFLPTDAVGSQERLQRS